MTAKPSRTSPEALAHVLDQLRDAGEVSARKMFGEYGIYCDGRFVGVVVADRLYIKPTKAGEALEPGLHRVPAYEGANPTLLVTDDLLEDAKRLCAFVRASAAELPPAKPRKPRS